MDIKDRVKQFLAYKGQTINKFENICGLAQGTVGRMSTKTRDATFSRIAQGYPDLNIEWLRTGEGNMVRADGCPCTVDVHVTEGNANNVGNGNTSTYTAGQPSVPLEVYNDLSRRLEAAQHQIDALIALLAGKQ